MHFTAGVVGQCLAGPVGLRGPELTAVVVVPDRYQHLSEADRAPTAPIAVARPLPAATRPVRAGARLTSLSRWS
jgi:hypothetical protein